MKYPIGTKIRRNGVSYTIIDHEPARMKRGDGTLSDGYVAKLDDIHQPDKPFKRPPIFLYEDYMETQFTIDYNLLPEELFTL